MNLSPVERRELTRYLSYYDFSPFIKDKTFLITGGKGLCGAGVIQWLLMENALHHTNAELIVSTRTPAEIPDYIQQGDPVSFCAYGTEAEACKDRKIDYIIHMAAPTQNSYFKAKPVEALRVIIDATEQMLELAAEKGSSMIYLSSEEVYGLTDSNDPIAESYVGAVDSLTARSCYPLGKKAAELLCFTHSQEYGTDVKIIRPTSIQGLFQSYQEERLINELLRCILEKKNLRMKSDGRTKKCLIYSLDAVSGIFTVLFRGEKGQAYNASNPNTFMAVKDLAKVLFEKFAPRISVEFLQEDTSVAEGYLPRRALLQDITKLKALGWEPRTDLEQIYKIDIQRFGGAE